jgi:hypothetical protein
MPSDTFETIQNLIQGEIGERENAAAQWELAAGGFAHGDTDRGDCHRSQAFAAQNRAECYRLNRLKLEREIETQELILQ